LTTTRQPQTDAAATNTTTAQPRARRAVVFGLGALLIIFNAFFGTYAYVVVQALIWTQTALLRGPVVVLFFLVLVNLPLLRFARRWALTQSELLLLYAMLCLGTCAAGYGFVQILINQMAAPFYENYATGGSGFKERLWPHVPAWFAPRDPAVLNPFFRGNATLYDPNILAGWAIPVAAWSLFIFAIFWTLLCALTLVRRQWIEEERLTFPLVLLPLEMTRNGGATPFWTNKFLWAGFVVAGLLESVNALNFLYPSVPGIPIKPIGPNQLDVFLTLRPWSQAGMLRLAFYPFVIGIAYLLSLDVSFSCWFLYVGVKVTNVVCAMLGLSDGAGAVGSVSGRAPFVREQGVGAFLGIAVFSAWMARRALVQAWREMRRPTGADKDELMSFRLALRGGAAGLLFLVGFLALAGLPVGVAAVYVFVYVCFSLTLARIVSEAGAGWAWAPTWSPGQFTTDLFGANALGPKSLTLLVGYTAWMSDMRDNPLPQQAQAAKTGAVAGMSARAFLAPLLFASALGIVCAFWAHLHIYYEYGAATAKVRPALSNSATGPFRTAASLILTPTHTDVPGLFAAFAGLVFAVGLSVLRQQFPWWPFHPLGYALATTQSMDYMWFPFFLAWLAKRVTLRYGGIGAYRTALPFFLGLILGDYVVPALWGVFGMASGYQQYMAFPH